MSNTKYTPLGNVFYETEEWKRKKVLHELSSAGIPYTTARTYFTRVRGYKVPADVQRIILETIPEASNCFERPKPEPIL
jgi:hypothetical protein